MSYLDVARNYAAGDFAGAVNGWWSPLFCWLIAGVYYLFPLSARIEFPVVHLLDFLLFLVALAGFEFFLRELLVKVADAFPNDQPESTAPWVTVGYSVFGYACIALMDVGRGGPDFLCTAAFLTATALLLRLSRETGSPVKWASLLGLVLGLGYLAKAVLFPISFVVGACAAVVCWRRPRGPLAIASLAVIFTIVAAPWIVALSSSKGRLTTSDTARLNYAWYVDDAAIFHWQGDPVHGQPLHPTRMLAGPAPPRVFEFGNPLRATYPVWYDPSYWNDGLKVRPHLRAQVRRWSISAEDLLAQSWFAPAMLAIIALALGVGREHTRRSLRAMWFVIVCAIGGVALYFQVLILGRYVAPFFITGLTASVVALGFGVTGLDHRQTRFTAGIARALAGTLAVIAISHLIFVDRRMGVGVPPVTIANQLRSAGIGGAAPLAMIGDPMHAYWAHLDRDRFVAEIPVDDAPAYWRQNADQRARLLDQLGRSGASAVVADNVPEWADLTGWTRLGRTGIIYRRLK
jgi:4-amino-4-deoxy-L-arabinose transferase-like glycosyltransferase